MLLDLVVLGMGQRSGLEQYRIGDPDLADVMKQRAKAEDFESACRLNVRPMATDSTLTRSEWPAVRIQCVCAPPGANGPVNRPVWASRQRPRQKAVERFVGASSSRLIEGVGWTEVAVMASSAVRERAPMGLVTEWASQCHTPARPRQWQSARLFTVPPWSASAADRLIPGRTETSPKRTSRRYRRLAQQIKCAVARVGCADDRLKARHRWRQRSGQQLTVISIVEDGNVGARGTPE
jgi:hypothetical protein